MVYSSRIPVAVFSAHAEVVLRVIAMMMKAGSILRARGGSSPYKSAGLFYKAYSPRTRR